MIQDKVFVTQDTIMVDLPLNFYLGFPGGSDGKESASVLETCVLSLGWGDPLGKEMATHSNTLAWKIHGWKSLVGYSPWGHKELDTTVGLHFLGFYNFGIHELNK